MKGRPTVDEGARIVNFAEFTAPQKYKDALLDLQERTGREKHVFFREALKEYCELHNLEYFIDIERREIARKEQDIQKMQASREARDEANRNHAEKSARRALSEQMYYGVFPTARKKDDLAERIAKEHQLPRAEVKAIVERVYDEFYEKYGDNPRRIMER